MRTRLPMVLSLTALAVALLGTTPISKAAKEQLFPAGFGRHSAAQDRRGHD